MPRPVLAEIVFSYWQKWNHVAPDGVKIQDAWPEFSARCIMVSELSGLNTARWTFAEGTRGNATGFTGAVSFTLLPRHQCGEWAQYWDGADRVLQSLAQFAFYCGTGHHASIGMGQTRVLPGNKAR